MPSPRQIAGDRAETYAAETLQGLGWVVLGRKLRTPFAEIDLLCRDPDHCLVLVEVKARSRRGWLDGEDRFGPAQRQRQLRAAEWLSLRTAAAEIRLDLLLVDLIAGWPVAWELLEDVESYR